LDPQFDVIVIGGGHAGVEAAWSSAAALGEGGRVALVTMDPSRIGAMSCNPAIGGLAKGQIVREIDAMGGIMARAIDATGIMFKVLNQSRGPAVQGPRAQADRAAYQAEVQRLIATNQRITVVAGCVDEMCVDGGSITGVRLAAGSGPVHAEAADPQAWLHTMPRPLYSATPAADDLWVATVLRTNAVVLTTGTFMAALMHTGEVQVPGGRVGEGAAIGIAHDLTRLGFELGRLKTGTPPRLLKSSIDWEELEPQHGDSEPRPFSDLSPAILTARRFPALSQITCHITSTTAAMHELIRANLHRAPMYSGQVTAEAGPRYCPSIEDKVVRFADRQSHHVFLEPETLHGPEIYCNGISTSLPPDVQEELVRHMPGCLNATILRHGYAVEYDMVRPHQIDSTCMTKRVHGLFLAGQINGTSGYEEAGGQGVIAGLNAARLVRSSELVRLGRDQAYIGVMLDDLVTCVPIEPYRMFTSRAEHRLRLRADNADARLTPLARQWGLIDDHRWAAWQERSQTLSAIDAEMEETEVSPGVTVGDLAKRPGYDVHAMARVLHRTDHVELVRRVAVDRAYAGYIRRQDAHVKRQAEVDGRSIPSWMVAREVTGLRTEAIEAMEMFKPATMGQASRLAGVSPADITVLAVAMRKGPTPSCRV
jgi:tRNA uridine 5-carboxymethylaminomethyl modification enzyme